MVNEIVYTSYDDSPFTGSTYSAVLPAFSVNTVRIYITNALGLDEYSDNSKDAFIYPNPSSGFVYFTSEERQISVEILNNLGQKTKYQISIDFNKIELKKGIYFIRAIYSNKKATTYKFIKQ